MTNDEIEWHEANEFADARQAEIDRATDYYMTDVDELGAILDGSQFGLHSRNELMLAFQQINKACDGDPLAIRSVLANVWAMYVRARRDCRDHAERCI